MPYYEKICEKTKKSLIQLDKMNRKV